MLFSSPLTEGILIKRYKRFLADVTLKSGEQITVHVPNTGSMKSSSAPGSPVALSFHDNPKRKYAYTLELVHSGTCWIGVNTSRTNKIVEEAIQQDRISSLTGYSQIKKEVKYGEKSRVDLLLQTQNQKCYVEVKNVTYIEGKQALFPDAVTERGARHMDELASMVEQGHRAVVFFLINRSDCTSFSPAKHIDPYYTERLIRAHKMGVETLAYSTKNTLFETTIQNKLKTCFMKTQLC